MAFCYISLKKPHPTGTTGTIFTIDGIWKKTGMLKMLLDKRITDLFSSSCVGKCLIKKRQR